MAFDASQDQKDRQRETSYSGNPRDGYEGSGSAGLLNLPYRRVRNPAPIPVAPRPQFPFMFGIPPSQMTPNFMPQIAPPSMGNPNMGNPMNLEQLYSLYGVGLNQPMPFGIGG